MLGRESDGIFLDIRGDGIFLILDNKIRRDQAISKNPMKLLEGTGIVEVNADILLAAFADKSERVEVQISQKNECRIQNETITIEISKDVMEAKFCLVQGHPWFGKPLEVMEIVTALKEKGIVFGVLTDVIKQVSGEKPYGKMVQVAVGRPPVPGKDGCLKFYFDKDSANNKPKILDNGNVDYKDTNYILKARMHDLLVECIDPMPGKDGVSVRGEKVPFKPGKPGPRLPRGKNTYINDEATKLFSEIDGQIVIENGRISVAPILNIDGDVGHETGNIDFTGSVFISGTIMTGFSVKATGDVEVKAAVEGALIEAGGNVSLLGGFKGIGKGVVKAGGDVFTRYAERATLIAEGDITSDSIMHSVVKCKKRLVLEGKKGLLVGGTIYAGKSVTARTIGSTMATATDLTVGNSPEFIDRYKELEEMYKKVKNDYDNEKLVEAYKAGNEDLRMRSLHARIHLRVEMDKMLKEMNELLLVLNSTEGIIRASQVVHPGVKIIVGGTLMRVQDDIPACTLRNSEGKVTIGTYIP